MQLISLQKQVSIWSLNPRLQEAILIECFSFSISPMYSQSTRDSQYSSCFSTRYRKQQFSSNEQQFSWALAAAGSFRKQPVRQGIHRRFFYLAVRCDLSMPPAPATDPSQASTSSVDIDSRSISLVSSRMSLGWALSRKASRMQPIFSNSRSGRKQSMLLMSASEQVLSLTSLSFSRTRLLMSILSTSSSCLHSMTLSSQLTVYLMDGLHSLTASHESTLMSTALLELSSFFGASYCFQPPSSFYQTRLLLSTIRIWMMASLLSQVGLTKIVRYLLSIEAIFSSSLFLLVRMCSLSSSSCCSLVAFRCSMASFLSISRQRLKSALPCSMEWMMSRSMKLTKRGERMRCSLRMKATSASSSRTERGRIMPSSQSTLSTAPSGTMKNSSMSLPMSCSRMKMANQSPTLFQKQRSLMPQRWRLRKRKRHSLRLQRLYFTYWRTTQSELRQTIGMEQSTLLRCSSKQSPSSSTAHLYLNSPAYSPNSSSNSSSYFLTNSASISATQWVSDSSPRSTITLRRVPMQTQSSGSLMPWMMMRMSLPNSPQMVLSFLSTLQTWFICASSTIFSLRLSTYLSSRFTRLHMKSMLVSLWMLYRSRPYRRFRQDTSWLALALRASTQLLYSVPSPSRHSSPSAGCSWSQGGTWLKEKRGGRVGSRRGRTSN